MPMTNFLPKALPWALLLAMGTGWGLAFSLQKMAMTAGGTPLGMAFWQTALAAVITFFISRSIDQKVQIKRSNLFNYLLLAILASALPSSCLMFAAGRVPAGVIAINTTIVPMLTYALAIFTQREKRSMVRIGGIVCGFISICLLVIPETSLPNREAVPWIFVAALAPTCHAINNINVTRADMLAMTPIQIIYVANAFGAVMLLIVALSTDQFILLRLPFGLLEWVILANGLINVGAFFAFFTLIKLAGPVFASQAGYLVTIFGVIWGMVIFNEVHSGWVWSSLVVMLFGLSLVLPKKTK